LEAVVVRGDLTGPNDDDMRQKRKLIANLEEAVDEPGIDERHFRLRGPEDMGEQLPAVSGVDRDVDRANEAGGHPAMERRDAVVTKHRDHVSDRDSTLRVEVSKRRCALGELAITFSTSIDLSDKWLIRRRGKPPEG
jgi:hypothetical protein